MSLKDGRLIIAPTTLAKNLILNGNKNYIKDIANLLQFLYKRMYNNVDNTKERVEE